MKIQLLLFNFILSVFLNAQEMKFPPGTKFSKMEFEKKIFEVSNTNIIYKYTFIKDVKTSKSDITSTILSIGNNYTKFYDYNRFLFEKDLDSINKHKKNIEVNDVTKLISLMRKIKFQPTILGQFYDNKINYIFQDKIYTNKFQYDYEDYKLDWKLTSNIKDIGEYKCKEAILNFGGRKWIAYYAEMIPLNYGPYIFNGLPGLILEIYDEKNEHHFLFEGIISNKDILIYQDDTYAKNRISKNDFLKGIKNFYDNPVQLMGKSYSAPNIEDEFKSIPYNPIELE